MRKIANIITEMSSDKFSSMYNVIKKYEDISDMTIPTLIVGYENAKEYIKNFSILEKKYNNKMIWWSFKKNENRNDFYDILSEFSEFSIKTLIEKVKYIYIDLINFKYNRIKNFIFYINNQDKKNCFITRDSKFIFIYDEKYNIVFGLSLTLCEYLGIKRKKVINKILRNKSNILLTDTSFIENDIRKIIKDNIHYILPLYVKIFE